MPKKKKDKEQDVTIELLQKTLAFQLYVLGVPQGRIAKIVEKSKSWVNDLLQGIPKGGKSDGY